MRLLLDTHVLLGWLDDAADLSTAFRSAIADASNDVVVSAITFSEIAIKASLGKLVIPETFWDVARSSGFDELDFSADHARELGGLPWLHRDPFDRMLIAQARVEQLRFVTADERCRAYEVQTL